VSNADDDLPKFEDLDLPGGELAPMEPAADDMFAEVGPAAEPTPDSVETQATGEPEPGLAAAGLLDFGAPAEKSEEEPKAEPKKEKAKKPRVSLSERLEKVNPYTVLLGLAILALLAGILCLYLELDTYKFDTKAEEAKTLVMARPLQFAAPSAMAAACPIGVQFTASAVGAGLHRA